MSQLKGFPHDSFLGAFQNYERGTFAAPAPGYGLKDSGGRLLELLPLLQIHFDHATPLASVRIESRKDLPVDPKIRVVHMGAFDSPRHRKRQCAKFLRGHRSSRAHFLAFSAMAL